jgi:hypothetical protein
MSFKIEITPRDDPTGATAYAVVVIIDDHETVLSFESKEAAERFAETERARLIADEQNAGTAPAHVNAMSGAAGSRRTESAHPMTIEWARFLRVCGKK